MIIDITKKTDTIKFAKDFSKQIKIGKPVLLYGPLGCGKTFFTSHLIQTLTNSTQYVPSPTFSIVQNYISKYGEIAHYDLYRIKNTEELYELDIDNSLQNKITIIEWPEIIENYIKENFNSIHIYFKYENGIRSINIEK